MKKTFKTLPKLIKSSAHCGKAQIRDEQPFYEKLCVLCG